MRTEPHASEAPAREPLEFSASYADFSLFFEAVSVFFSLVSFLSDLSEREGLSDELDVAGFFFLSVE
jgi:hypothetical protein